MRLPTADSLALRLVFGAAFWSALALVAAGFGLSFMFTASVERSFEDRLAVLLDGLIAVVDANESGDLALVRAPGEPRFDQPYSGWYWQVNAMDGTAALRSRSLFDTSLKNIASPNGDEPAYVDVEGPQGEPLAVVVRRISLPGRNAPLVFCIAGDRREVETEIGQFNQTLAIALTVLGLGLVIAVLVQVRFGLEPLARLRGALAAIRTGRAERLEGRFPAEVRPLADELNQLLEHNAEVLGRARTHVGNLAHALKTPLAVLSNDAEAALAGNARAGLAHTVQEQATLMRRHVDHHLSRARAAGAGNVLGARTDAMEVLDAVVRTLEQIHAERTTADGAGKPELVMLLDGPDQALFKGERHDLEEMTGNLIDNACKWANRQVHVGAQNGIGPAGPRLRITVEDDGPGLPAHERERAFQRGQRLDEATPGTGLGLAIVRDIAGLYGGAVSLDDSALGGLKVTLDLPALPRDEAA